MILKRFVLVPILAALGAVVPFYAAAQRADGLDMAAAESEVPTAPVEIDGNVLFRVRGISAFPAEQRAATIRERILGVARDSGFQPDQLQTVESEDMTKIMAEDQIVMGVIDADSRIEGVRRQELARTLAQRIRKTLEVYRHARKPEVLRQNALHALTATAVLAFALAAVIWLARRLDALMERRWHRHIQALGIQSFEIVRAEHLWGALRGALAVGRGLTLLAFVLAYFHYVLALFPWTRRFADRLLAVLIDPLATMGQALVADIPDLAFLAVLFAVIRYGLKLMRFFFDAVAGGSVKLAGFQPEWARPTYRIARVAVIAFALVIAYPYIPGSQSAAFKGVSIFLGVVFSLGSSSIIANSIAGYTLIYRRAFKVGDRVQIGEVIGDVMEMRVQVTHLRSLKNEEVTVPNSLIMNSQVVNYSSLARTQGLILHTTVGIGYEVPWRQVEAMLLMAAERTPGLQAPRPFVLQKSLGDFAINYELNVYCTDASAMMAIYTALHRNILDVFNEYGVQIMTPAYEYDPTQPKVVPKAQWYAAPAQPEGESNSAPAGNS